MHTPLIKNGDVVEADESIDSFARLHKRHAKKRKKSSLTFGKEEIRLTVAVVGDGAVGKTALILRAIDEKFDVEKMGYSPTIKDWYVKESVVDGIPIRFDILDTPGQEDYEILQDNPIRAADAFLVVFSTVSEPSLKSTCTWIQKIRHIRKENGVILLVGSKQDLGSERADKWVSTEKIEYHANKVDCPYLITSSKTGLNVNNAFHELWSLYFASSHYVKPSIVSCCCISWIVARSSFCIQLRKAKIDEEFKPQPFITSLKNISLKRSIDYRRFLNLLILPILPILLLFQTCMFFLPVSFAKRFLCMVSSGKYFGNPKELLWVDILGIWIGRSALLPEEAENHEWFLRQSTSQLNQRVFFTGIICLLYIISFINIQSYAHINDMSKVELYFPPLFVCVIWVMVTIWSSIDITIKPSIFSLTKRLSDFHLCFDLVDSTYYLSVLEFIQGYAEKYSRVSLSMKESILQSLLIAILPLAKRLILKETLFLHPSVSISYSFFSFIFCMGSLNLFNLTITRNLFNYLYAMQDMTYLIQKDDAFSNLVELARTSSRSEWICLTSLEGCFISFERTCNIISWLELRSFFIHEGYYLFSKQEVATSFLVTLHIILAFACLIMTFLEGSVLSDDTFYFSALLLIYVFFLLGKIAYVGNKVSTLQRLQEKFILQQHIYLLHNKKFDYEGGWQTHQYLEKYRQIVQQTTIIPKLYGIELTTLFNGARLSIVVSFLSFLAQQIF